MSEDNEMYRRTWSDERYPPRARGGFKAAAFPEGEDYFSMMEKHGKPIGPFDKDRQLPYKG
jgi:hypothetical protein